MSSGSYAFKMKFNLSVTVLMVVAKESEICYRLNLQNLTTITELRSEVYSEPCRTSGMEPLAKINNRF